MDDKARRVESHVHEVISKQLAAAHLLLMERRAILTYDERVLKERIEAAITRSDLCLHQLEIFNASGTEVDQDRRA